MARNVFFLVCALLAACTSSVLAKTFPITGPSGDVHPRMEISHMFYHNRPMFDLYVQALLAFQQQDEGSQISYYGISGIHGTPNTTWDGVGPRSSGQGYCVHAVNLFAPWHRPYIALFEQRLITQAKMIAATYPAGAQRTRYTTLANNLRQPYWDWAAKAIEGRPNMPNLFTEQHVTVNSPTGKKQINNPLFTYHAHPLDTAAFGPPFNTWVNTLRYPSSSDPNAVSQNNLAQDTIHANRPGQCSGLYQFFTNCPTFDSTHDYYQGSSPSCGPTLESLHNNIHDWVGSLRTGYPYGHMTVIPYSAFDPVFMLHHTQIDRLFALWQALYPDSYVTPEVSHINTYTIRAGDTLDENSPLTPFHRTLNGGDWTSAACRNWEIFKYTYPEFVGNDGSSATIRTKINNLYGGSQCQNTAVNTASTKRDEEDLSKRDGQAANISPLNALNGSSYQYIANIATTRFGLNESYLVSFFLGAPGSENSDDWVTDPNFAGSFGIFSSPGMTSSPVITTGTVSLTIPLSERVSQGAIPALDEVAAVPYLATNLQWRVTASSGILDPSTIPNFLVTVYATTLQPAASDDEFPTWSPFIVIPEITHGKAGGLKL